MSAQRTKRKAMSAQRTDRVVLQGEQDVVCVSAEGLAVAWRRYTHLFGEPPHGTKRQFLALLALVPRKTADAEGQPEEDHAR